ncbi:DUF5331 domain-containing protein [Synechococcus sp. C9]|uniref:DUF5331 domain-containing protein n=1 Tax=Synechococcus sp. C9 TaxID=102119 RepID=UPI001FF1477A|nr:DUF5331 domain-containing protein [Synechococcus sp. C9]
MANLDDFLKTLADKWRDYAVANSAWLLPILQDHYEIIYNQEGVEVARRLPSELIVGIMAGLVPQVSELMPLLWRSSGNNFDRIVEALYLDFDPFQEDKP